MTYAMATAEPDAGAGRCCLVADALRRVSEGATLPEPTWQPVRDVRGPLAMLAESTLSLPGALFFTAVGAAASEPEVAVVLAAWVGDAGRAEASAAEVCARCAPFVMTYALSWAMQVACVGGHAGVAEALVRGAAGGAWSQRVVLCGVWAMLDARVRDAALLAPMSRAVGWLSEDWRAVVADDAAFFEAREQGAWGMLLSLVLLQAVRLRRWRVVAWVAAQPWERREGWVWLAGPGPWAVFEARRRDWWLQNEAECLAHALRLHHSAARVQRAWRRRAAGRQRVRAAWALTRGEPALTPAQAQVVCYVGGLL